MSLEPCLNCNSCCPPKCPCRSLSQPPHQVSPCSACAEGNGLDSEAMKMNPGVPPYMVYHIPMMYGGFGDYSYNPHWVCSIPVMPSPATVEEGKQTPLMPGTDGYQQMVAVGGWGQGNLRAETEGKMAHLSTTITHGAGAVVDPITKGGTTMLHISTQIIMATTFMHVIENLDLSRLVKDTHWQWVAVTDSRAVHPAGLGHEATEGHRSFCRKRVAVRSSTGAQRRNVVWGRERECAKVTPLSTSPGNITCNTLSSQPHLTAISHQLLPCI
ncbi:uncharacterized protein LOC135098018 isoform X2 [Scylla paramamosain]|uniref:uncharacterized protein LOC135098018 isoform X2 n=1 Tax=Scylla paramamosain TaxID=85552 RepID=UPI003082F89A